jgi:hypothetical protein
VDDTTHLVSGCGRFTVTECQESARREHLILAWIKGEIHPCAGTPTRTSGEWRLSNTSEKHRRVSNPLLSSNYFHVLLLLLDLLS